MDQSNSGHLADPGRSGGTDQAYGERRATDGVTAGLTLAEATAAIITARWNAPPTADRDSRAQHPSPSANGQGTAGHPTNGYHTAYPAQDHVGAGEAGPPNGHGEPRTYGAPANGHTYGTPVEAGYAPTAHGPYTPPQDSPYAAPQDISFAAPGVDRFAPPTAGPYAAPVDGPYAAPVDGGFAPTGADRFAPPTAGPYAAPTDGPYAAPVEGGFAVPGADRFAPPADGPYAAPADDPSAAQADPPSPAAHVPSPAAHAPSPAGGADLLAGMGGQFAAPADITAPIDGPFAAGVPGFGFPAGAEVAQPVSPAAPNQPRVRASASVPVPADHLAGPTAPDYGAAATAHAGEYAARVGEYAAPAPVFEPPYPYPPRDGGPAWATAAVAPSPLSTVDAAALLEQPSQRVPLQPGEEFHHSVLADLTFPEPFEPEPFEAYDPLAPRRRGDGDLPQRVPAEPDVPEVLLPLNDPLRDPATAPTAEPRELSRIATFLRVDDRRATAGPQQRPDGFDLNAVLTAVRSVPDVSDAQVRWNAGAGHTLRIEFKDGVDEGRVTREVARLLRETMGLTAAPSELRSTLDDPLERTGGGRIRGGVSRVSTQAGPPRPDRPLPPPRRSDGTPSDIARTVVEHVQVTTVGNDAVVEVRLGVSRLGNRLGGVVGSARGPAVEMYLLRLAASAAADAVDQLLTGPEGARARCVVEQVAVMPFAGFDVAVVVLLLVQGTVPEQLSGSAVVAGDPVQAVVRATLSAVNRRMESLLL